MAKTDESLAMSGGKKKNILGSRKLQQPNV
jgi:hypothetical protein